MATRKTFWNHSDSWLSASGQLVPAGDTSWELELETRLYRRFDTAKPRVIQAWSALKDGLPA